MLSVLSIAPAHLMPVSCPLYHDSNPAVMPVDFTVEAMLSLQSICHIRWLTDQIHSTRGMVCDQMIKKQRPLN